MAKGEQLTILLVDDHLPTLHLLARRLNKHDVVRASDHQEALQLMLERLFDLVVSDYDLGAGPNGADVLAAAAMLHPRSVRVLLTGEPPADLALLTAQGMVDSCIRKPFKASIASQLEALVRSQRPADEP